MTGVSTSAPGKVLLCGEYVVLNGAPSLCVAIDRRANVHIQPREPGEHAVTSPGFADGQFLFSADSSGEIDWRTAAADRPDFSLLEQVWADVNPVLPGSVEVVLDTRAFVDPDSRQKLGLGGSAALTVALSAALARLQSETVEVDQMIASHRQFQNGMGSGTDIATAYAGGLIEYRIAKPATSYPMQWRGDIEFAVLWSGSSVSTAEKLSHFSGTDLAGNTHADLAAASAAIVRAWPDAAATKILSLFRSYTDTLAEFSEAHGLGIFDEGHAELLGLAADCDVIYKPCGAGGGDVGIVLSTRKDAIDRFVGHAASRNFVDLHLSVDDNGLAVGDR